MALPKFLTLAASGLQTLVTAAISTSAGAADADKIPALDASGRLDQSFMPTGIGADTRSVTTSEAVSAGNLINIWDSTGAKARKADASTNGKAAIGFVLAGATSGGSALVYFEGTISGLSGLVPGASYFLSATTPGAITNTAPTASGQVVQYVGTALSATELSFEPAEPILIA